MLLLIVVHTVLVVVVVVHAVVRIVVRIVVVFNIIAFFAVGISCRHEILSLL